MPYVKQMATAKHGLFELTILFEDGHTEDIFLAEDTIVTYQVLKGKAFTDDEWTALLRVDIVKRMVSRGMYLLSFRMRTAGEIRRDLMERFEDGQELIPDAIYELENFGYINDAQYAHMYTDEKRRIQKKGPLVIKKELNEKEVAPAVIDLALESYTLEKQTEAAQSVVEKIKASQKDSASKAEQKAIQRLLTKGFAQSVAVQVVKEHFVRPDKDEEAGAVAYHGEKAARKWSQLSGWEFERKMKQVLYQKGFPIHAIQEWLQSRQEEDEQ
ncbi:RecX family transcriptional regulator [Aureibacillus halotolerans]|uniref:Regulatory protein RecX n=1 Tax=Aureibacillus halotolerans TaxID=1508390 RepID=A0A4R6TX19_9BACI|nr:RecX family transcriptional regulator [Aureibacillus halotolerans]TDQ33752.1 regulatory protein [Aureibacillus halotolerans]